MIKTLLLYLNLALLSSMSLSADMPNGTDAQSLADRTPHLIERTSSLAVLEVSSLVQAGLQEKGFTVRFVQPIDKGLKKYQDKPGYLRVIVFDPPSAGIPVGAAGDELHVFVPLRIAIIQIGQGSKVSVLPYADLAGSLSTEAGVVMQHWGEQIAAVIGGVPE